ncbi:MAG: hypothetical protein P9L92_05090 [Candidatus Electryonea clarkiae]|nr:hypothetical protein [Candidatus Electryonea clarkiae]MDP8287185.1 hypothetical protein [Candidatus Electryonea clarkiae]
MTELLEKAFTEATKLPESEQDSLAKWMLEEFKADRKWAELFSESENLLERLADEALEDFQHGKTAPMDLHNLEFANYKEILKTLLIMTGKHKSTGKENL